MFVNCYFEYFKNFHIKSAKLPNLHILFYLFEVIHYDFKNISMCKKIIFVLINYNVFYKKNKFNESDMLTENIKKYIGKILQIHSSNISRETLLDNRNYDSNEPNMFDKTELLILTLISKNNDIFNLLLEYNYANTNVSKWIKNIILYSTPEIFELYWNKHKTYIKFNIKILNYILDTVWEIQNNNRCRDFILYFIEKFDSDIFSIKPKYYDKFISQCLPFIHNILKSRPELDNDEFIIGYMLNIHKLDKLQVFIQEPKYAQLFDSYWDLYLENICLNYSHTLNITKTIEYVLTTYPDPSKYNNRINIIINTLINFIPGVVTIIT